MCLCARTLRRASVWTHTVPGHAPQSLFLLHSDSVSGATRLQVPGSDLSPLCLSPGASTWITSGRRWRPSRGSGRSMTSTTTTCSGPCSRCSPCPRGKAGPCECLGRSQAGRARRGLWFLRVGLSHSAGARRLLPAPASEGGRSPRGADRASDVLRALQWLVPGAGALRVSLCCPQAARGAFVS